MTSKFNLLAVTILFLTFGCQYEDKVNSPAPPIDHVEPKKDSTLQVGPSPRIVHVTYGKFCGECGSDCTDFYRHYLIGNVTTFWTDPTDSYFSKGRPQCNVKMSRDAERLSFELIRLIPDSILQSKKTMNQIGCLDCDDGCGLYFEFQLDDGSKPVVYTMPYDLKGTKGQVRQLGQVLAETTHRLKQYK
jgi:hypothetical protein